MAFLSLLDLCCDSRREMIGIDGLAEMASGDTCPTLVKMKHEILNRVAAAHWPRAG